MFGSLSTKLFAVWGVARSSAALKQSMILLVTQALTAILLAVSFLLASRVLGPTWFGVFSVFTALVAVWMKVPDLGLNQAIITSLGSGEASQQSNKMWLILNWKWWASVALLVVGSTVVFFFPNAFLSPWTNLFVLSILGGVCLGVFEMMYTFLLGRHQFWAGGILSVGQALGKLTAFGMVLWWASSQRIDPQQTVYHLGVWYILFPALCSFFFIPRLWRWMQTQFTSIQQSSRQELLPFLRHTAVGTIAMTLLQNVDVILVQNRFSAYETGLYAGAARLAVFVGLLTYSLSGVLNNRASRYKDKGTLQSYIKKSLSVVCLAIAGFLIFYPLRSLVLQLSLGVEYLGSEPALNILLANAFLSLAVVPFIAIFYGQDDPTYFSVSGVIQILTLLTVYFIFADDFGILAMAWARFAATNVLCVYTFWKVVRLPVWKPPISPGLLPS